MQVATSQRPHPPPVPPRPSRQVVAEALKRSPPRPPCPTRQAPPPPNTKPWRSEDHEVPRDRGGRTIVYESFKDSINATEVSRCTSEQQRPIKESFVRRSEKVSQIKTRNNNNSSSSEDETFDRSSNDVPYSSKRNAFANKKIVNIDNSEAKVPEIEKKVEILSKKNNFGESQSESEAEIEKNDFETLEISRSDHSLTDRNHTDDLLFVPVKSEILSSVSLAKNVQSPGTTNLSEPPTINLNVNNDSDLDSRHTAETNFQSENKESSISTRNNSATTISSDDCTTVVVIDEPERRISLNDDNDNIHHQDWLEAGVRYSSTKITLPGDENTDRNDSSSSIHDYDHHQDYHDEQLIFSHHDFASIRERIAMSSLQGLPPLPRSLSGFNLNEGRREAGEPPPPPTRSSSKTSKNVKSTQPSSSRPSPPGRQLTTLDTQLAILRKEMFGLRQLDLSLLSQLWSLNESIQEFRQLLQEQDDRAPSPSPSSEEGDDTSYGSHPPPPPRRPAPMLHHHRPPRPPRPLRPPASDESPSSEEYGAV